MSLDRCEEFVGPATPTGRRRECLKPTTHYATSARTGEVVALCAHHVRDYAAPAWLVVRIAGR